MRRIGSDTEIEKKRKRNALAISFFMLIVLVGGTAGFAFTLGPGFSDTNTPSEEQGIRFQGGRWIVPVNGQDFSFANSPDSVKEILVETSLSSGDYSGAPLYISSDDDAPFIEIGSTLGRFASQTHRACHGPCEADLPEKDCSENLVVFSDSTENKIYQEENCVFIEGDLETVDAFLFDLFGINQAQ